MKLSRIFFAQEPFTEKVTRLVEAIVLLGAAFDGSRLDAIAGTER